MEHKYHHIINAPVYVERYRYAVSKASRYKIVSSATRSDGHIFFLMQNTSEHSDFIIRAGCREFTLGQFRRHANTNYERFLGKGRFATAKKRETLAILDLFKMQIQNNWAR